MAPSSTLSVRPSSSSQPLYPRPSGFDLRERYFALHGLEPERVFEQPMGPEPEYLVDLGPVDEICYRKKILEGGTRKRPRYCHQFGERWPSDMQEHLAPVLARDEFGRAYLLPQRVVDTDGKIRDATFITDHGYEDLPMSSIRTLAPRNAPSRANPEPSRLPVSTATKASAASLPYNTVPSAPASPRTRFYSYSDDTSPGYTQVRVRKIGPIGVTLRHALAGFGGAFVAPLVNWVALRGTSLPSWQKGLLVLGASSLAGVGLGAKYPRLGAGVILGGAAVAGMHGIDELATRATAAFGAVAPVPQAAPQGAQAAPQPPSAPAGLPAYWAQALVPQVQPMNLGR